jgi:cytochrome c peroxidase
MTVRTTLALALSLTAGLSASACKKDKKDSGSGNGTAAASGSAAAGTGSAGSGTVSAAPRASDGVLPALEDLTWPEDPKHKEKRALGYALFFEMKMSVDGTRSCYSCHLDEDGNGGHDPLAIGPGEKVLARHSPVIWNVAYFEQKAHALYWDGRSKTLPEQAKAAWGGGNMGVGTEPGKLDAKAAEIAKDKDYKPMFAAAYPDVKTITATEVAEALAVYMRTLVCKDTAYDKFARGDKAALTEQQKKGLDIFMGERGQCNVCHAPPYFSTAMATEGGFYQNAGIGTQKPEAEVDIGRMKISNKPEDWAAFKVPSLRNVSKSAPYFHDGSVATLEAAVKLMAEGGIANKNKSALLQDRKLTADELADLVAFLGALDCNQTIGPHITSQSGKATDK